MTVVTSPMSEVMMTRPPVTVNSGFVLMPVIAVTPEVTRWPYSVLKNAARGLRTDMSASYQATRDDLRLVGFRMTWRRSEEHTSELQSLMRISYAVFCLKKKTNK